jgi:parvulin-like peptidyl-prolyl isomerase
VKLRQHLLTMAILALGSRAALAWQYQPGPRPDPYTQPPIPGGNTGFRFGGEPEQPGGAQPPQQPGPEQPAPQQPINRYQPPPQQPTYSQPGFQPPAFQQPAFQQPAFQPPAFQPPAAPPPFAPPPVPGAPAGAPPGAPAMAPQSGPYAAVPAGAQSTAPVIPGYDPTANTPGEQLPPGQTLFQPSQIVATVGNQYILYGDVSPDVNQLLEPHLARAKTDAERAEIEAIRPKLTQQMVRKAVESKILYLEFDREMEMKAGRDKIGEIRGDIAKKMRESFEKELQSTRENVLKAQTPEELQELAKRHPVLPRLAILMKEHQIETLSDLDQVLRRYGSSLDKQQRAYADYTLGRINLSEKLKVKSEVSHLEMVNYYREHEDDFSVKARAKFEIITVKYVSFPSKQQAYQAIAQMGNEVFYGTPFAAVARRGSSDPNAAKGGAYDWTTEGSLASEKVDQAIFTMELNALSPIIEDERGYHILRVTAREPAGLIPFTDAQVKIKELINQQRREAAYKEFVEGLRKKTVVWTIYDTEAAASLANQPSAPGGTTQR